MLTHTEPLKYLKILLLERLGVTGSAVTCYAGGPGSIPAAY